MCPFEQGSGVPAPVLRDPFGERPMQQEHSLSKSKSVSRDALCRKAEGICVARMH